MSCGRRPRRAAVPGSCWLSSGMFVCCGSWRPCCRPCLTSCSRPMSWWPWTQQVSSLVSSQEDGSGMMHLCEGCVCPPDGGMCCTGTGKPRCEAAGKSLAERSAVAECKGGCFAPKVNFQVCKEGGCRVESQHVQGHICSLSISGLMAVTEVELPWGCRALSMETAGIHREILRGYSGYSEGIHREMLSMQRTDLVGFS